VQQPETIYFNDDVNQTDSMYFKYYFYRNISTTRKRLLKYQLKSVDPSVDSNSIDISLKS
ncbi:hypothetical protein BgiMline_031566, partial [Biomphalaria glabrata]